MKRPPTLELKTSQQRCGNMCMCNLFTACRVNLNMMPAVLQVSHALVIGLSRNIGLEATWLIWQHYLSRVKKTHLTESRVVWKVGK